MLRRDFMPRTYNTALEKREGRFHGVSVNVAVRVFAGVIDGLVLALEHGIKCPWIDSRFIGQNDFYFPAKMRIDDIADRHRLSILSADQPQISIALTDADNNLFIALCPPAAFLAAYIGFFNLNRAVQRLGRYLQHGRTNAMAEVPCRLVTDS